MCYCEAVFFLSFWENIQKKLQNSDFFNIQKKLKKYPKKFRPLRGRFLSKKISKINSKFVRFYRKILLQEEIARRRRKFFRFSSHFCVQKFIFLKDFEHFRTKKTKTSKKKFSASRQFSPKNIDIQKKHPKKTPAASRPIFIQKKLRNIQKKFGASRRLYPKRIKNNYFWIEFRLKKTLVVPQAAALDRRALSSGVLRRQGESP